MISNERGAAAQGGGTPPCDYNIPPSDTAALIAALNASNSNTIPETICLGGGTYTLTTVDNYTFLTPSSGGSTTRSDNGLPLITDVLTIEGANSTIVAAPVSSPFRFFQVSSTGDLTLNQVNFSNGAATAGFIGSIYSAGKLTINGGVFSDDHAGSLYISSTGITTLDDVAFHNSLRGLHNLGTTTIYGGEFTNNTSSAIYNSGTLIIDGTDFIGNSSTTQGGAIYNLRRLSVSNARFLNNTARTDGGALYSTGSVATITGSIFRYNAVTEPTSSRGGAIRVNSSSPTLTISQSCIADNSTAYWGGTDVMGGTYIASAANNWWGAVDGPSGAGTGSGDSISAGTPYTPILTAPIPGCEPTPLTTYGQSLITMWGAQAAVDLRASGGIPPYTFSVTGMPAFGTLSGSNGKYLYAPSLGYSGADGLTFTVTDAQGQVASASVQLYVDVTPPATIVVNTAAQEIPSVVNGNCTLSEAITAANTNTAVDACAAGSALTTDVISLPSSTYTLSAIAVAENSPTDLNGLPYVTSDILIAGNGSTLQRQTGVSGFRLIRVMPGARLTLLDLTLSNGHTASDQNGGGAVQAFGTLILKNTTVRDSTAYTSNTGQRPGGGITMNGNVALWIYGGAFTNNQKGGIVAQYGSVTSYGTTFSSHPQEVIIAPTVTLVGATFTNNIGGNAVTGKTIIIRDSTFTGTISPTAAAVKVADGTLEMTNTLIQGTQVANYGGAVYIIGSNATITGSRILTTSSTQSPTVGAGLYIQTDIDPNPDLLSNVTISDSCIVGNTIGILHQTAGTLNAANNWWGAFDGPSGIQSGGGDRLQTSSASAVTYQPFLTADPAGCGSNPPGALTGTISILYETQTDVPLRVIGGIPPYTVTIVTPPQFGVLTGVKSPLSYTPNAGFVGTDTFTYQVTDSAGKTSNAAAITLPIISNLMVEDRVINTYTLPVDFTLEAAGGVLPVTFSLIDPPDHGAVSGASPDFTYTPDVSFAGSDVMVFQAEDSAGFTADLTVTLHKYDPLAVESPVKWYAEPGVPTPIPLTFTGGIPPFTYAFSLPQYGTLSGATPASLTYTYMADPPEPDTVTVTITGSDGLSIDGVIDILPGAPFTAPGRTYLTPYQTPVGGTLTIQNGTPPYTYAVVTQPAHGVLSGTLPDFTYTPNADFHGIDGFDFRVTDANDVTVTGTMRINVLSDLVLPNQNVIARYETLTAFTLQMASGGATPYTYSVITPPVHGALDDLIASGPSVKTQYMPDTGYFGADSFVVEVEDAMGTRRSATISIDVRGYTTVAAGDTAGLIAAILAANAQPGPNTILLSGGTYSLTSAYVDPQAGSVNGLPVITDELEIRGGVGGAIIARASGAPEFRIMMNTAANSMLRNLTLQDGRVSGGLNGGNLWTNAPMTLLQATLQGGVASQAQGGNLWTSAPLALQQTTLLYGTGSLGGDFYNGNTSGTTTILDSRLVGGSPWSTGGLLYNTGKLVGQDSIFAGGSATQGSVLANMGTGATVSLTNSCVLGTDHQFLYSDHANSTTVSQSWFGNPAGPYFTYSTRVTVSSPLTSAILGCPTATGQSLETAFETPLDIQLSGMGTAPLTYLVSGQPSSGTVSPTGGQPHVVYTPGTSFSGTDTFSYRVADATGLPAYARITIAVAPDLVASDQTVRVGVDAYQSFMLQAGGGKSPYAFLVVGPPAHGSLSGTAPNLVYTPAPGYSGSDLLTFQVTDEHGDGDTGTISFIVAPLVASDQSLNTAYGTELPITLNFSGGTPPYAVAFIDQPAHGVVIGDDSGSVYVPATGFTGVDTFVYRVTDAGGAQETATVTINVGAAQAVTITVTSTLNEMPYVNNGNCTLGEAIRAAESDQAVDACAAGSGADVIFLPAGTYLLSNYYSSATDDAFQSLHTPITVRGAGMDQTVIEPTVGMFIFNSYDSLTLESLTVRNDQISVYSTRRSSVTTYGTLRVNGVRFEGNTARRGGAIYATPYETNPVPTVVILNSQFDDNYANSDYGGAVSGDNGSTLNVYNTKFQGNEALVDGHVLWWSGPAVMQGSCLLAIPSGNGVAVSYNQSTTPPTPAVMDARFNWWGETGSEIDAANAVTTPALTTRPSICGEDIPLLTIPAGDVAALAAAIEVANSQPGTTVIDLAANSTYALTQAYSLTPIYGTALLPGIVGDIVINGNGATITRGTEAEHRLMAVLPGGSLTLNALTLTRGRSDTGSAVYVVGGTLTVRDSRFYDNGSAYIIVGQGGALAGSNAVIDVAGSIFEANRAWNGGAIYAGATSLMLQDNLFLLNQATTGGSVYTAGLQLVLPTVNNCFVHNGSPSVARVNNPNESISAGFTNNWWGDPTGPSGAGPGSGDAVNANVVYDPFLTTPPAGCDPAALFTASATVEVELQGYATPPEGTSVQITLSSPDGTPILSEFHTLDANGLFTLDGLYPGDYSLRIKPPTGLAIRVPIHLDSGANTVNVGQLLTGDANGDNTVDNLDVSLLTTAFGKSEESADFNPEADLNGDSMVNILDFSLLSLNYGTVGAE